MSLIEIIDSIDIERVRLELEMIPSGEQLCLQGVHSDGDPFYGIGSDLDFEKQHKEDEFNVCLFNTKYINSILDKHNVVRTRVMRQQRKTCYTYHIDYTKRIHIPVYTNDNCFLILNDSVHRLRADGSVYLVDTTVMHTAVNASTEERTHIIGNV